MRGDAGAGSVGGLLWVTPEQGTFTAERMLLGEVGSWKLEVGRGGSGGGGDVSGAGVGVSADGGVDWEGGGFLESERVKPLGDLGAGGVAGGDGARGKGELAVFGGGAERAGFIEKLDGTLRELRQYGHSGESLQLMEGADAMSAGKLADLAVLLEAWNSSMEGAGNVWDVEKMLEQARCGWGSRGGFLAGRELRRRRCG